MYLKLQTQSLPFPQSTITSPALPSIQRWSRPSETSYITTYSEFLSSITNAHLQHSFDEVSHVPGHPIICVRLPSAPVRTISSRPPISSLIFRTTPSQLSRDFAFQPLAHPNLSLMHSGVLRRLFTHGHCHAVNPATNITALFSIPSAHQAYLLTERPTTRPREPGSSSNTTLDETRSVVPSFRIASRVPSSRSAHIFIRFWFRTCGFSTHSPTRQQGSIYWGFFYWRLHLPFASSLLTPFAFLLRLLHHRRPQITPRLTCAI
ncbi:hypothetical protein DFH07DRAFT_803065 [Mycena maculata]|uniref:Uncharacterized protein n=1 Tax=Mycena maculata TaxID=230809 RepID=A0AAD7NSG5_9AGAR|nr:hypothetical protein DFH07DRAFT_803065 [Mycena maculata]